MYRRCEDCRYYAKGRDNIGTPYCGHPHRTHIFPFSKSVKRPFGEREVGRCGPNAAHWEKIEHDGELT